MFVPPIANLSDCNNITPDGVEAVALGCPQLQLFLPLTPEIRSARQWLEYEYSRIDFQFNHRI